MKSISSKLAVFGMTMAMTIALTAGMAVAQSDDAGSMKMHHGMHGGFMGGPGLGFPLHQLNLSDDQKAQVKQIFQNEHANIKPLMQQEFVAHQQMMQLITSGAFDPAKANAIATQEAQTHVQMEVEHAKIGSQIYALLDSTQKAKVADMIAKHQERMQQHLQNQPDQQQ